MKKRFLSMLMLLVMVFALAGCAGKEENKIEDTTTAKEQETTKKENTIKEETTSKKETTKSEVISLEEWYEENKESLKDEEDELTKSYDGVATVTLKAEDNTLIYYTIVNDKEYNTITDEEWVQVFDEAVSEYMYTYVMGAKELVKDANVGEVSARIEVYKMDGSMLYSYDSATEEKFIKEGIKSNDPSQVIGDENKNSQSNYTTLEDWYNDNLEVARESEKQINAAAAEMGYKVELYAEGNTWVYCNTYENTIDVSDPAMQQMVNELFDEDMKQRVSEYEDLKAALELNSGVNKDDIKIRVIWLNPDGSLLYDSEHE